MTTEQAELDASKSSNENTSDEKAHPWRTCPLGKHYVRTHNEHIPPSRKHPEGQIIVRHAHCANNPSHKDMISFDEIKTMTEKHFADLSGSPAAGVLTDFPNADKYDELIRGWVRYWNDIFNLDDPLDPNLVKALMATESAFDKDAKGYIKRKVYARGLLQITEQTRHVLSDHKGELNNYLIPLTEHDLFDPSSNICGAVRWLFRKKVTASAKLGREATWDETIIDYKGYWNQLDDEGTQKTLNRFRNFYKQLQGQ